MTGLRKDARELIDSARHGVLPSNGARKRVRAALAAKVGTAALITTTGASGAGSAFMSGSALVKLGAAALVITSGAFGIRHVVAPKEVPTIALPALRSSRPLDPVSSVQAPKPFASAPSLRGGNSNVNAKPASGDKGNLTSPFTNEPASQVIAPSAASTAPIGNSSTKAFIVAPPAIAPINNAPASSTRATTPAFQTTLAAETELLRFAHQERAAGRTDSAMAALSTYRARFPRGLLWIEASAERILALCEAGRTDEARALGSSLAKQGTTVQAVVENSCARSDRKSQ